MILDQTIHGGNTPDPFVTKGALDEVKDSIQELRSILLRGRGGPYHDEGSYYGMEMDNRGRRSRQSGDFGPPFEANNDPLFIPASQDHPPPGVTPILWHPNPGEQRHRHVRLQSPSPTPIIIQPARSRSSSIDRYDNVDTGTSRRRTHSGRTDATYGTVQELESVIEDFSSIVIIVGAFFSEELFFYFDLSQYRFLGHLPRFCIHRDALTRAQRIRQPRHAKIESQPSF